MMNTSSGVRCTKTNLALLRAMIDSLADDQVRMEEFFENAREIEDAVPPSSYRKPAKSIHDCDTAACLAGWASINPILNPDLHTYFLTPDLATIAEDWSWRFASNGEHALPRMPFISEAPASALWHFLFSPDWYHFTGSGSERDLALSRLDALIEAWGEDDAEPAFNDRVNQAVVFSDCVWHDLRSGLIDQGAIRDHGGELLDSIGIASRIRPFLDDL